MSDKKDKEVRRLQKAKIDLMRNPLFVMYSGALMVGSTVVSDDVPTACTNGRNEIYGRGFIKALNNKELAFVVLHECMHKIYRHLTIWRKLYDIDARLANMACDYVINLQLRDMDKSEHYIAMPRKDGELWGCYDEQYRGMHTKQVWDLLRQQQKAGGGAGGEGDGFDEHQWQSAGDMSAEEKEALVREVDQAMRQGLMQHQKIHGKGAGGLELELEELLYPQIPWQDVLREFMKSVCANKDTSSWRRVNRRYLYNDIYLPSLVGESMGRVLIGVDTSGSVSSKELATAMSEVKGILEEVRPAYVDLMYWGHVVEGHETYDIGQVGSLLESTRPVGGGGTDPECVVEHMRKHKLEPDCVVMLTDGHVPSWGSVWAVPVIWVVIDNPGATADHGITLHVRG
jgi:predicted metal-dependent peptidase